MFRAKRRGAARLPCGPMRNETWFCAPRVRPCVRTGGGWNSAMTVHVGLTRPDSRGNGSEPDRRRPRSRAPHRSRARRAGPFVVNTAGNAGDTFIDGNCDTTATPGLQCTLRGAIQEANGNAGLDTINFALASPYRVTLNATGLPTITSPVLHRWHVAAGVQPRWRRDRSPGRSVEHDRPSVRVRRPEPVARVATIKGLEIDRFNGAGIQLQSNNNVVSGNYIGTTAANTVNCAAAVSCSDNVGVLISGRVEQHHRRDDLRGPQRHLQQCVLRRATDAPSTGPARQRDRRATTSAPTSPAPRRCRTASASSSAIFGGPARPEP